MTQNESSRGTITCSNLTHLVVQLENVKMIKFQQVRNYILVGGAVFLGVISFQNCGSGFEAISVNTSSGLSSDGDTAGDTGTPNRIPALVPQTTPASLAMNVTTRVALPILDSDTNPAQINFVIITPPRSGQVVIDTTNTMADRGFSYTPNVGFIGEDTLTIYPIDPEGNRGPNQTLRLQVEARGIGQMLGNFAKSTCTPTTSPIIASYSSSNLGTFQFRETIFSADCGTPILEHVISGAHSVGAENVPTLSGLTGFEYNVINHSSSVRPLSAQAAQTLNAQAYCGLTGWAANVTRDITLTGCNGVWASTTIYMFRRVEFPVGQPARLYISDLSTGVGTSPQTRTRGLATNLILTKVP